MDKILQVVSVIRQNKKFKQSLTEVRCFLAVQNIPL